MKLPELFDIPGTILPERDLVEQASSSATARYVAQIIDGAETAVDLTAGMGVNTWWFANKAKKVYAIEIDADRADLLKHNFKVSGIGNVEVIAADCLVWLAESGTKTDVAFADPARRDAERRRKISLEECSPAVSYLLPFLNRSFRRLIVKVSPFLDLTDIARKIPELKGIHVVEYKREVKEVLLDIWDQGTSDEPYLKCVRLKDDCPPEVFDCSLADIGDAGPVRYAEAHEIADKGYLYEPSPALMKSACFGVLAKRFPSLRKLGPNTHLFFSETLVDDFPGRVFQIEAKLASGDLKRMKGERFGVISRNHPAKAPEIENRYKLKSSDERFLIACTLGNSNKMILKVKKLSKTDGKN